MCKPTASTKERQLRLLVSLDSFESEDGRAPSLKSCAMTTLLVLAVLFGIEHALRYVLQVYQHVHPLLQTEAHRQIIARHVGVDTLSCFFVSWLGWQSRHHHTSLYQSLWESKRTTTNSFPKAAHDARLFTYLPSGFRVALFFFCYQVKNLYDSYVWNDGPEFLFHHIFSLVTALGAMHPGCGHYYCLFFFGICEISTSILCLLSNFDDEHGVPGLGDAMPLVKVALGATFVVSFIIFRCILWPIFSYYFGRDVIIALKGDDVRTKERKGWLKFFLVSLAGLSVLQVAWLGQIFVIAKEELAKVL